MISVVIPLYNKEMYIKKTIENVLNQTFQKFELIVVNDGSQDNGSKIVESFSDPRIQLINKENGGVSSARNVGIKEAKYDYIAFLDADDEWLPNHLEEIHKLIVDYGSEANIFVTNFARKYTDGQIVPNRKNNTELQKGIIENYFKTVLNKALIHTSCVCVSKKAIISVGMFDKRISRGEDMDLWFRLARKYKVAYSPIITEYYLQDALNSCNFELPEPHKIYAYYLDFREIKDEYDYRIHKLLLRKRQLRYFFLDKNFIGGIKLLKKQWKNLF